MSKDYLKVMTPGKMSAPKASFMKSSDPNSPKKKKKKVTDYMDLAKGSKSKTGC